MIFSDRIYLYLIATLPVIIAEKTKHSEEKKINIDKTHLAADFLDLYGMLADIFSTDKEMELQYFASHDYDNNKKLDGLELFNALNHDLAHEADKLGLEHLEKYTENEVDAILSEYDMDNDGFLDYTEFDRVEKVHEEVITKKNETKKVHEEVITEKNETKKVHETSKGK